MRQCSIYFIMIFLLGCNKQSNNEATLKNRVDSLEKKLAETYKPGFGEIMSNIQTHHLKLWFAGKNKNWELAKFETHEITESIEAIQKFQNDRKESQLIKMIFPALDSINKAIQQKNSELFNRNYSTLTNTCNSCHKATNFEFNIVKIPDSHPFSNQDFKISK